MRYDVAVILRNKYNTDTLGHVYSYKGRKPRTLKQSTLNTGHKVVNLRLDGHSVLHLVHRLVWVMHYGPIPEGYEIEHLDGNPANNAIRNLALVTHSTNIQRYWDNKKAGKHVRCYDKVQSKHNSERATTYTTRPITLAAIKLANMKINVDAT
ncbi:HNH endonuclease [Erwinia phage Era103]|uniref:1.45-like protein n=1 Tax=Erwinia phage Era103 TaxID=418443 RepID=A2I7W9_9CAUD|nr:HNH endonuclease [Erwinia phage Era103]ABM63391.1 1.45-like protein [Erwinia phage Era103]